MAANIYIYINVKVAVAKCNDHYCFCQLIMFLDNIICHLIEYVCM